jgi:deoxyribodipyrimidine photo-lyase
MVTSTIQEARIKGLNDRPPRKGAYVLYWMQQSQRARYNHALEYAVDCSNELQLPLLVGFGLTADYPEANLRHYTFMLEGLAHTRQALEERGIQMVLQIGDPPQVILELARKAAAVVCDCGYTRHQKKWRREVAENADCRVVQVESDVVVPVGLVSPKAEYAARTIRPKIKWHLDACLKQVRAHKLKYPSLALKVDSRDLDNIDDLLKELDLDESVPPVSRFFPGGAHHARRRFNAFLKHSLKHYDEHHNQPQTDDISGMSPYLHFGQISPLYLALRATGKNVRYPDAVASYIEELIIRRELAVNFVHYSDDYDAYGCLPEWARKSLEKHRCDKRPHTYSRSQLEDADTHDPYWNAAMREMRYTGFMHNYMRMYWGKKILEWSASPRKAYETTLALNNKYFLDGRDPNSFVGVGWTYGLHDRAWFERDIFGKVRYMAASGLERKCDIQGYVKKVDALVKKASR